MRTRRRHGFTLIELMVALTILSILVGFAIPELIEHRKHAAKQTQLGNLAEINKAIHAYYSDHGRYPVDLAALTTATHPYFLEIPIDPLTGRSDTWLVTSKSVFMAAKKFYTQGELPAKDPAREGIYLAKAPR